MDAKKEDTNEIVKDHTHMVSDTYSYSLGATNLKFTLNTHSQKRAFLKLLKKAALDLEQEIETQN